MSKLSIHDNFIRSIMADKNIARDYFEHYLPSYISNGLDFETLEQSSDTYISKDLQKTMSDIVYSCQIKDSDEAVKVTMLIEHKSYKDKNTPIQIGSYIFSGLLKQVINKEKPSIIIPILLYHGKDTWEYHTLADLFVNLEPEWKKFLPNFSYIYNDLGNIPDEQVELLGNKFLVASILALKHSFDEIWLENNVLRLLMLSEGIDGNLQTGLVVYLFEQSGLEEKKIRNIVEALPSTLKSKIMSTADMFIEKGKKIGFEKGVEEGLERGKTDFVTNLLKNTNFDTAKIAALADVSTDYVLAIQSGL